MRVLFVTSGDRERASSRYRVYELLPFLESEGFDCEVLVSPGPRSGLIEPANKARFATRLLFKAAWADAVYVQKVLLPPRLITTLNALAGATVFDFDDALYAAPPGESVDPARVEKLRRVLSMATAVVAGSDELAEHATQYASTVYTLPTAIPRERYDRHALEHEDDGVVRVGWIGHPENLHYLSDVEKHVAAALNAHSSLEIRIITAGSFPVRPFADRDDVEYIEWTPDTAIRDLSQADVGIRPLRDDEWTRGKGGFTSVIQSMALGQPVVVTPVGMLEDVVKLGTNGFHATEPGDWETYLSRVVADPSLIRKLGTAARESVSECRFWSEDRAADLAAVFRSLDS